MTQITITRNQFEKLKEVFEKYNPACVTWTEESTNGIGPKITLDFAPTQNLVRLDITDVSSW